MLKIIYSVVVPVFNSEDSLKELARRIDDVFSQVIMDTYELIMIDDGSSNPETWDTIEFLARRYPSLKAVRLTRNFGKPGAVLCGFNEARGDYIIMIDDDLQNRPEDIPKFIEMKDHDVVIGIAHQKRHSLNVVFTSWIAGVFDHLIIGLPKKIKNSPFKLIKAQIAKEMLAILDPYPYLLAQMLYVTKDFVSVEVEHDQRKYGSPGYTFHKRLFLFLRLLINNSALLLKTVAAVGISMAFLSAIYSFILIFKRLYYSQHVSGWTSIMVIVLITSGLLLFSIGIVGEYLIRIINGIEGRPPFIIRQKTDNE